MIYENNYIIQVFYILHNCVVDIFDIFSVTFFSIKYATKQVYFFLLFFTLFWKLYLVL
ncbi:hypothetical protein FWK35_00007860 [Aphis craccivora]|uniref:Uncharacterized protein n=1 Tax=Aphis craccivora TaxID=307492 RepID=A0A6G0Z5S2_APHCR|nr:hypothetical protein FWK35_00007860 [Aphis craccivora]